ncbi:multidrug effflux MFS transporter [Rufibacter quisquiliarum]|uniref:DHA1 family bicyclomycin/chloramphenicol resistance-like MFS transporter n=1 Tax=Rufibacter quisquiliarum TaxID=1549639 RepID=A0A839GSX6_9BACT|nr:multidrug effflux MFS transporter [Rufibacter quisquiliarum]MBA9077518.1 DHA1 family bicyclomycin/chloramphenicol resistance-like MFS transporter [Rufibacter quisquiliarum]
MTRRKYILIILILGSLSTISPFSIDMYLPGFPAIAQDLNTTIAKIQLSLTAYLIGISVGQLLYGPLLDRFGRKLPLYAGLLVYVAASVGCAFTTSADGLILMRFIQAIGGCAGMVAAQALVRDLFPVTETAKVFSWLILVIAVSPMIAPTVGGYVTAAFGWHAVFIALAVITFLILVGVYIGLPEGKRADPSMSLKPAAVLGNFWTVLRHPQFLVFTLVGGIASAAPFAYIAGSPDVFMNIYGVSEQEYGWIFAFLSIAMVGSPQLNHILLRKLKSEQIINIALVYQLTVGVIMVAGVYLGLFGKTGLIAVIFLFLIGQGLTAPNASALSLAPFSRFAGSASALSGSFRMGIGALVSGTVSIFHNGTALPMVGVMTVCTFTGILIFFLGRKSAAGYAGDAAVAL